MQYKTIHVEASRCYDIYIGKGASPTAELESLDIKDEEYWATIMQVEEDKNVEG